MDPKLSSNNGLELTTDTLCLAKLTWYIKILLDCLYIFLGIIWKIFICFTAGDI